MDMRRVVEFSRLVHRLPVSNKKKKKKKKKKVEEKTHPPTQLEMIRHKTLSDNIQYKYRVVLPTPLLSLFFFYVYDQHWVHMLNKSDDTSCRYLALVSSLLFFFLFVSFEIVWNIVKYKRTIKKK